MAKLPLPDELLSKVYSYILPIFTYAEYVRNVNGYNDTRLAMILVCNDCHEVMYYGDVGRKLENIEQISVNASLQIEYLNSIKKFMDENPRFVRPDNTQDLTEFQYLRSFDVKFAKVNMKRMENNLRLRRGMWQHPDTNSEIMLFHDIPEILFNGTTRDLIYSCIINNVRGFKTALKKELRGRKQTEREIVRFINKNYINIDKCVGGETFRRGLIRSLMRL